MIRVFAFDLDGTLVQTERLKARSYAKAAVELCPQHITEDEVMEAYKGVVGRSREEVASTLMQRFDLTPAARKRMDAFDANAPWEAFVGVRLAYYHGMIGDPDVIQAHRWPHALSLLETARDHQCAVALATTSRRAQATQVLDALGLSDAFDFVTTADDVSKTKPHPEMYRLVAVHLEVHPDAMLAIEDSPAGVEAAITAGLHCVAVTTEFTHDAVHASGLLEDHLIVDDPDRLPQVVSGIVDASSQ